MGNKGQRRQKAKYGELVEEHIKKLFQGKASLRDYNVRDYIKNHNPVRFTFSEETGVKGTMTLSPEELRTLGKMSHQKMIPSKFAGAKPFQLIDYPIRIDKVEKEQLKLEL